MSKATFIKDPQAILDYTIDWSSWLATGELITSSSWTVQSGITEDSNSNDTTTATIWLSGGSEGSVYRISNLIDTDQGRRDERSFLIEVKER